MTMSGEINLVTSAKTLSSALPDLLVEAHRIAATVASGWHGRRQAGTGETFWQFRPFSAGEAVTRIDWRKSARDDSLHVREREWESAHTIWLWPDLSASMDFRSALSTVTKRDRTVVLTLAIADLLSRGGERIGLPGILTPTPDRKAAERVANALALMATSDAMPDGGPIRRFQDVILIGDFLDPLEPLSQKLGIIAASGVRGHLLQVLDPAEETFPFSGRTEFRDPETGQRITSGRAERWGLAYRARMDAHRTGLRQLADRFGWSFLVHHTDRPATEPLLALHARLSATGNASAKLSAFSAPKAGGQS